MYAKTEQEYVKHRTYMKHLLRLETDSSASVGATTDRTPETYRSPVGSATDSSNAVHSRFDTYFTKNWDNCKAMWCAYTRQSAVTLGNNTNNRLESSWKQLKDVVDTFTSVDDL